MKVIDGDNVITTYQNQEGIDWRNWFYRSLRVWPWFVISVAICLLAAFLYLRYTNPIYKSVASIMVKDEKKGAELMDNSMLKEIGLGGNSKLVENEIEVLKSIDLIEATVNNLQLYLDFRYKGNIRDVPSFGKQLPFSLTVQNAAIINKPLNFTVIDTVGGIVLISGLDDNSQYLPYGKLSSNSGLLFRVEHNKQYEEENEGEQTGKQKIFLLTISNPADVATYYSKRLSVDAVTKLATVINLELNDKNKERGVAFLRSLIETYNAQGLEDKNKVSLKTIEFLDERLQAVTKELQGVEGSVEKLKSENKLTDLSVDAEQYLLAAKDIDVLKSQNETQLNIIRALEKDLTINQDNPQLVPSTLGIQEPSLGVLIQQHNELILQAERIKQQSGPLNPLLIDLGNQLSELRKTLLSNVRKLVTAYQIALDDVARKDSLLNTKIRNVPKLEKRLVQITRNQGVQQQLYSFLLQKREEVAVSGASNIEDSRIIVRARSLEKVSPKPAMTILFSVLAGFLLPFLVIMTKDFLNTKIGDVEQIQENTQVAVIGSISHVKKLSKPIVISSTSRSVVSEQIRTIRTAISYSGKETDVKKLLITSFQPGDGKSFVSLNLAASNALLDKRTVILEFDLRKPQLSKNLDLKAEKGISSVLTGKCGIEEALIEIPGFEGKLFLLPAGYLPPNPAELISNSRMVKMIQDLDDLFDIIIIDTPPFSLVTDALLLEQYADMSLVVLRQNYTNKAVYSELNKKLAITGGKSTFIILNDVGKAKRYQSYNAYGKYGSQSEGYYQED